MLLGLFLFLLPLGLCVDGIDPPTLSSSINERKDDTGQAKHKFIDIGETNDKDENMEAGSGRLSRSLNQCRRVFDGKCTECYDGYHGKDCQYTCSRRCADGCFQHNGLCRACPPGYHGSLCDQICPLFCRPSYDLRIYCGISTGHCLEGCQKGHWGLRCSNFCKNCINTACIFTDGSCMVGCKAGFWGEKCQRSCPSHCKNNNCSSSGQCIKGCMHGRFGSTCEMMCSKHCKDGVCSDTGYCIKSCFSGFSGHHCNQSCPHHCHSCNRNITECFACDSGFTGRLCEADIYTSKQHDNQILLIFIVTLLSVLVLVSVIALVGKKAKVDGAICLSVGSGLKCHDLYRNKQNIVTLIKPTKSEKESFV